MSEEYHDLTPYILNECNQLITTDYIENILKDYVIKIKVKNIKIFQNAMTHISYLKRDSEYYKAKKIKRTTNNKDMKPIKNPQNCIQLQDKSYERLEFLGDAVLEIIVTEYLFVKYPDTLEGEMTSWRASLVNTKMLSETAQEFGFNDFPLLSAGEIKENGKARQYILADTLEAFIGALYLDSRLEICEKFIIKNLLKNNLDRELRKLEGINIIEIPSILKEIGVPKDNVLPVYKQLISDYDFIQSFKSNLPKRQLSLLNPNTIRFHSGSNPKSSVKK